MDYRIEVYDLAGRRIAAFDEVPLLEVVRAAPDQPDLIQGIMPEGLNDLSHGYRITAAIDGRPFCEACVRRIVPQWGDTRKLVLDQYVRFHEVVAVEAERPACAGNTSVVRAYQNRCIDVIVKDAINSALGPIHYLVAHAAYPDGAQREYAKFLARKLPDNELEVGGIASGQWVGAGRINSSGAYAKDGDTIAGLVVDGQAWPDLRLLLIDCEETARNYHAIVRHPEVAEWTDGQYAASGYCRRGEAAKAALQALLDAQGIDYIELNPHRDAGGAFDDRVDAYGRYVGLIYGGGECLNAAMVEQGHADVYLYQDGRYHVPEMELKDFFSYCGESADSIESAPQVLVQFDVKGGVFEVLTALAYAAGGYVWSLDVDQAVRFRKPLRADAVVYFNPVEHAAALGSDSAPVVNALYFDGSPFAPLTSKTYTRGASIDEYGFHARGLEYFSIALLEDADKLCAGLLDDLAYPEPCGRVSFFHGNAALRVGDLVELRDGALRRLDHELAGEWQDRFAGQLIGRVKRITHRFFGRRVTTVAEFTSPLRSVEDPLSFMVRSQLSSKALFQFRLDDADVGLDLGYHLD